MVVGTVLTSIVFNCDSVLEVEDFRGYFPAFLEVGYYAVKV